MFAQFILCECHLEVYGLLREWRCFGQGAFGSWLKNSSGVSRFSVNVVVVIGTDFIVVSTNVTNIVVLVLIIVLFSSPSSSIGVFGGANWFIGSRGFGRSFTKGKFCLGGRGCEEGEGQEEEKWVGK